MSNDHSQRGHLALRESVAQDLEALELPYPAAFPDEDLLPLVRKLVARPDVLSLVVTIEGAIVGHVAFTMCSVHGTDVTAALLGPLAVLPDYQKRGIGTAIVREGLERLNDVGVILVLGDPDYYARFGFAPERSIRAPFPIPAEWRDAWQSIRDADVPRNGKLVVPDPWNRPELWAP